MAFFIPSYIQKRLLRYALSRVQLFDTDALDLEKLDVGIGRRSTVELRDVALRKANLATLLQLPSTVTVEKASVACLRLTVPADVYASPVSVHVDGVVVSLQVVPEEKAFPSVASKGVSGIPASAKRSEEGTQDVLVPGPGDLAKSFLEQVPQPEATSLQSQLNTQSTNLHQSTSSSGTDADNSGYGSGGNGVLSGFLAGFLAGVADRLEVSVSNVEVSLRLDLDSSVVKLGVADVYDAAQNSVPIDIVFCADHVDVEGVTTAVSEAHSPEDTATQAHELRLGKRLISLRSLQTRLDCSRAAFDELFPHAKKDAKTQASSAHSWSSRPNDADAFIPKDTYSPGSETQEDVHGNTLPQTTDRMTFSQSTQPTPIPEGQIDTYHPSFKDANLANVGAKCSTSLRDELNVSSSASRRQSGQSHGQPGSGSMHSALRSFRNERLPLSHDRLRRRASPQSSQSSNESVSQSTRDEAQGTSDSGDLADRHAMPQDQSEVNLENPASTGGDELLESKFFSHDEAESIYMSVIDDVQQQHFPTPQVPCAWDEGGNGGSIAETRQDPLSEAHDLQSKDEQTKVDHLDTFADQSETPTGSTPFRRSPQPSGSRKPTVERRDTSDSAAFELELVEVNLLKATSVDLWLPGLAPNNESLANEPHPGDTELNSDRRNGASSVNDAYEDYMPGSFSTYAESMISTRSRVQAGNTEQPFHEVGQNRKTESQPTDLEIRVGTLSSMSSLEVYSMTTKVFAMLKGVFLRSTSESEDKDLPSKAEVDAAGKSCHLHVFLNELDFGLNDLADLSRMNGESVDKHSSHLFHLRVNDVNLDVEMLKQSPRVALDIGKLQFDIGDQKVVRFDQSAALKNSIKVTQILSGRDCSINYDSSRGAPELTVTTLPVIINLDALRLNDTVDSIGGFSRLFDLGSSILSDAGVETPVAPPKSSKPRVRFSNDVTNASKSNHSQKVTLKLNVRIGGTIATIRAAHRVMRLESSAIKLVSRGQGSATQIDEIRLTGPILDMPSKRLPVMVKIRSTRLNYLMSPEEADLTRLITLVTPTKDNFEQGDGGVIVDTMLGQRKNGAAVRVSATDFNIDIPDITSIEDIGAYFEELGKMNAITKYLPEETRPGILALLNVGNAHLTANNVPRLGRLDLKLDTLALANVSAPSLVALSVRSLSGVINSEHTILHPALPMQHSPHEVMLMARLVGESLVPTIEAKLMNTCVEYDVTLLMEVMDVESGPRGVDALAASVATLPTQQERVNTQKKPSQAPGNNVSSQSGLSSFKLDVGVRDCSIGLTPRLAKSKGQLVLANVRIQHDYESRTSTDLDLELRKATLLLIDDRNEIQSCSNEDVADIVNKSAEPQIPVLCLQGYVTVAWVSAARTQIRICADSPHGKDAVDVKFDDELLVLESCADSTQTLSELFGNLQPPAPPLNIQKYRTEVATVEDMMASFTGDALEFSSRPSRVTNKNTEDSDLDDSQNENLIDAMQDFLDESSNVSSAHSSVLDVSRDLLQDEPKHLEAYKSSQASALPSGEGLNPMALDEDVDGKAAKWDSDRNKYVPVTRSETMASPFKLKVANMHVIWNLHDGYDWKSTRNKISDVVHDVEAKAEEKRHRERRIYEESEEKEPMIGDFLFNSIYVGVTANQDPHELTRQINRNVDDLMSETGSHATTMTDATPRPGRISRKKPKRLKLERSQRHKITFELTGIALDMFVFPPGQENVSSTDIRVRDFEIFDHVPTSTWKKFATYMRDAGPREDKKPMIHLEICNVKPVPDLLASELVMRVTVLPVRLHVDQDALDFVTRFFDFHNDDGVDEKVPTDQAYLQRVEVLPVPLRLDYKPKKVDYAGLRSGRTKEFMNFFSLDSADMTLKHAIIYGCPSFARLHANLEDIWMPDIKRNQLPTVVSGLNGVRTLVNVGSGVRNLVSVPIQEYKKDGRIVRSISKGAVSFARTSGSELTKFGARLAVGAQTVLQGAEGFLVKPTTSSETEWETAELDDAEKRAFSHYADQPTGILQGLRGAAKSLERDLLMTRDVVVAVSGEARESGSVEGAARAIVRRAPTIVLRPMIGASKAVSQTLMGATNTVDPKNRQRLEDKYKRY